VLLFDRDFTSWSYEWLFFSSDNLLFPIYIRTVFPLFYRDFYSLFHLNFYFFWGFFFLTLFLFLFFIYFFWLYFTFYTKSRSDLGFLQSFRFHLWKIKLIIVWCKWSQFFMDLERKKKLIIFGQYQRKVITVLVVFKHRLSLLSWRIPLLCQC